MDAVLFDMDGTLVGSDAAVARTWAAWGREYGVSPAALDAVEHGVPSDVTVRLLRPDLDGPAHAAAVARMLDLECADLDDVHALPGAHELLAALDAAGVPWAVVTSAERRLAVARLTAAGIAAPVLVARDDIVRGKPDPEGYLAGAAALGVDPRRCLVVEDAEAGLAAGRAAGARTAALRGLDGDLRPADLHELAGLLGLGAAQPGSSRTITTSPSEPAGSSRNPVRR
ncbi:HAD-IA family hydrolase [Pseudonocardia sp. HH130630-07]|uniref:HAD-IA family hydrolase n=1 Tax=Pseudonocardia sp. HH130630-07 TaxID=1690815 RepID=UPI001E5AB07B|nr:HAD-IA family hydrolase [Pseudonocardia sp. HH130630-07]